MLSEHQELSLQAAREAEVFKRNDFIQKARHVLTLQEQRVVLYAISKIKPGDTPSTEYVLDIKDFYLLCGIENESYSKLKDILLKLKSDTWWTVLSDGETESALSWFNVVRTNKKSGKVVFKFHEDVMPYLTELKKNGNFYTKYSLQYVLPMSGRYSPRLYEILKSYHYNNVEWFFDIDNLKWLLSCQHYENFYDFKRRVLEPAIEEINKFTDMKIAYETVSEGRRVSRITFYMKTKSPADLLTTKKTINETLDGAADPLNIDKIIEDYKNSTKYKLLTED